ncbi:MAG: hypothetical protein WCW64_11510 [Phycisphaerae bacterium]|jgi:hypothetical protein
MKTKIFVFAVLLIFANVLKASVVDITVSTDKPTYQLGEYVTVSITSYNPNPQPVTLNFDTSLQAIYLMDGTFDSSQNQAVAMWSTERTINAYDSYTWTRTHGAGALILYPLGLGIHSVAGEVVGYGSSSSIQFEVVPEPGALAILSFALPIFRIFSRKKI